MVTTAAQLELDIDVPVDISGWSDAAVCSYGRRLAVGLFMATLADARDGDPIARIWLMGWCAEYLDAMGLDGLARMADADLDAVLARVRPVLLESYLSGESPRCFDCVHCVPAEGGYMCDRRHWNRASLAESTVRISPKMREYQPCEDFEKREQCDGKD